MRFVKEVGCPNVEVMLDTFHMNIEEQSIAGAIRHAGSLLGHFHTGECNRMVPGQGRMPWREIGEALRDIGYQGYVVMEPFINRGGGRSGEISMYGGILNRILQMRKWMKMRKMQSSSNVIYLFEGQ